VLDGLVLFDLLGADSLPLFVGRVLVHERIGIVASVLHLLGCLLGALALRVGDSSAAHTVVRVFFLVSDVRVAESFLARHVVLLC
jgi:hypothetical protein